MCVCVAICVCRLVIRHLVRRRLRHLRIHFHPHTRMRMTHYMLSMCITRCTRVRASDTVAPTVARTQTPAITRSTFSIVLHTTLLQQRSISRRRLHFSLRPCPCRPSKIHTHTHPRACIKFRANTIIEHRRPPMFVRTVRRRP